MVVWLVLQGYLRKKLALYMACIQDERVVMALYRNNYTILIAELKFKCFIGSFQLSAVALWRNDFAII